MHSGKPTHKEANDLGKNELSNFKGRVMKAKGYNIDNENPDAVKYEVAKEQGVPLKEGYNGHLTSEQAGKVGGPIRNGEDGTGTIKKEISKQPCCSKTQTDRVVLSYISSATKASSHYT